MINEFVKDGICKCKVCKTEISEIDFEFVIGKEKFEEINFKMI